jgi:hypothetical protein
VTIVDDIQVLRSTDPHFASDLWAEDVLGHDDPEIEWYDHGILSREVPAWEVESVLCALEDFGPAERATFDIQRGRVPVTHTTVRLSVDATRRCPASDTRFVYRHQAGAAIAWFEFDQRAGRLMCVAVQPDLAEATLDGIWELATGPSSNWRRRAVELDPSERSGWRHLDLADVTEPPEPLSVGLRRNLILPLTDATLRTRVPRRGVLLHGRPGTGKTWALQWVAQQVVGDATVIFATPSVVGSAPLMRTAFEMAVDAAPVLLVLEDLDIGAGHRAISPGAFGELLNAMDGPGAVAGVFVGATTNHPEILDPALSQRPGRFDVTFEVPEAPESARRQALRTLAGDLGIVDDEEITELVQATNGWSMAEVAAIGHMAILISTDTNEPLSLLAGLNEINGNSSTPEPDARSIGYV